MSCPSGRSLDPPPLLRTSCIQHSRLCSCSLGPDPGFGLSTGLPMASLLLRHNTHPTHPWQCRDITPSRFHGIAHNQVLAHGQQCTQGRSSCLPSWVQAGRWDLAPFSDLLQASSKPKDIKMLSSPTWSGSGTSPHHSTGPTSPWDDGSELSSLVFLSLKVDQKSEHCPSWAQGAGGEQTGAPPNAYSCPVLSSPQPRASWRWRQPTEGTPSRH